MKPEQIHLGDWHRLLLGDAPWRFLPEVLVRTLLIYLTLLVTMPPNQPHRAEIAKMMTHPQARQRGIATRLIQAAEAEAAARGKTLLVLDTAADEGAGPFYEKLGYSLSGEIPDFALKPHGGLTGTLFFWKKL